MKSSALVSSLVLGSLLTGCGGGGSGSSGGNDAVVSGGSAGSVTLPTTYTFDSHFVDNESSVSYSGQTFRQVLIDDLKTYIGDGTKDTSSAATITTELMALYDFNDATSAANNILFSLNGEVLDQQIYDDISSGKNLKGKMAGNDNALPLGRFIGGGAAVSPEDYLLNVLFDEYADLASSVAAPTVEVNGANENIDVDYVSANGIDYKQMVQKFLLGAVAYSQGTDDYLQTDFAAGLAQSGDKTYSTAEHKWDEAFGYFGAARNYNEFSDDEIAGKGGRADFASGYNDANGSGTIDLMSEVNLANSTNCAKRDRADLGTDYTADAFNAFLTGRAIIAEATVNGELTAARQTQLETAIETASLTWEKCVAATVVHYINDVKADIDGFKNSTTGYASLSQFKDYAKHWSEMRGFALGFQFNSSSPFLENAASEAQLETLLTKLRSSPVLVEAGTVALEAYQTELDEALAILKDVYEFSDALIAGW
ncbi:DUF4856 domain-containing protein [Litoribacillus peritrichatus]|uniref:DUF4856 domain-containing protein n=1 Tax=Litoribacillus peritrichatus TaxID=718191 RepID=A0ABP7NA80_9GAMM